MNSENDSWWNRTGTKKQSFADVFQNTIGVFIISRYSQENNCVEVSF